LGDFFLGGVTSDGHTTTFMPGYFSNSGRRTASSLLHSATVKTDRGRKCCTSCAENRACPSRPIPSRLAFVCTTTTSLPSIDTSSCWAMRNSSDGRIIASRTRIPRSAPLWTAINSSTSVPPTCFQYQRVIGISCLIMSNSSVA